jgi:N utilization substance protein A
VSALIDHGLAEATVDALVTGGIGTIEKLGSMTPEQLEALEGIDEDAVNRIQQAINSFYGQEYSEMPAAEAAPEAAQEAAPETGEASSSDNMVEPAEASSAADGETVAQPGEEPAATV